MSLIKASDWWGSVEPLEDELDDEELEDELEEDELELLDLLDEVLEVLLEEELLPPEQEASANTRHGRSLRVFIVCIP